MKNNLELELQVPSLWLLLKSLTVLFMTHCAIHRRGIRHLTLDPSSTSSLWIKDEVLQEVWSSFCRSTFRKYYHTRNFSSISHCALVPWSPRSKPGRFSFTIPSTHQLKNPRKPSWRPQRRCGSSIPGPLEARKRRSLTRRMMDLSRSGGSGDEPGIGVLIGMQGRKPSDRKKVPWQSNDEILSCRSLQMQE